MLECSQRNQRRLRRTGAAVTVLALHTVALWILLIPESFPIPREQREEHPFYWLILPPYSAPIRSPPVPTIPQVHILGDVLPQLSAPTIVIPELTTPSLTSGRSSPAITLPTPEISPSLEALRKTLDCNLDRYEQLPPEEKAACAIQLVPQSPLTPFILSQADQKLRYVWEREFARKQAPFLVPCMSPRSPLDVVTLVRCLAGISQDGFDPDKLPTYATYPEDSDNQ